MKLYGSLTSPYVRKARILAIEKKLTLDFAQVAAADSAVSARNPLGKIPVLERDDGSALFDSPVIVEYLDSLSAPALIPPPGEARWQVLRWQALADGMMDATVARMMEQRRAPEQQSAETIQKQEAKVTRAIAYADTQLSGPWLVEARLTLADIAFGVALEYVDLRYPHAWKDSHPRLAAWHAALRVRASFTDTQPPV